MPANTVNRGYPYSIPADPADVAQAIEDLATAVDTDLVPIGPTIVPRRMFRVSNSFPLSFGTTSTAIDIKFNTLDVEEGDAIATFPDNPSFRVEPSWPGFWFAVGTLTFTETGFIGPPGTGFTYIDLEIDKVNTRFARQSSSVGGASGEMTRNRTLTVGGGKFMNGTTDYFRMASTIIRPAANPNANVVVFGASLTMWQMTQS